MTSRRLWIARQVTRRIWFRAGLFPLLAVASALVAIVVGPYIPDDLPTRVGSDAVDPILGIIASSMLAVTTFSLSTMVAAYAAATSNVAPRATKLAIEDTTTRNVLSTFIGSFRRRSWPVLRKGAVRPLRLSRGASEASRRRRPNRGPGHRRPLLCRASSPPHTE